MGATSCTRSAAVSRRGCPTSASSPAASGARACSASCAATASPRSCSRASTCRPASTSAAAPPAEIALSILAKIVTVRHSGAPGPRLAVPGVASTAPRAAGGRPDLRHDRRPRRRATPSLEHDGETIYFCCEGCKSKFEAQHEPCRQMTRAEGHGRGSRRGTRARARHRDARARARRGRLPRRRGARDLDLPRVRLPQPLLLEGEAGVGKTEAAKALAAVLGTPLVRLQCYEGIDAAEALYEWNYPRQLLSIRLAEAERRVAARGRPLRPRLPHPPAAAARARAPRAAPRGAADRRDRPRRRRLRGVPARAARRGERDDSRDRHDRAPRTRRSSC